MRTRGKGGLKNPKILQPSYKYSPLHISISAVHTSSRKSMMLRYVSWHLHTNFLAHSGYFGTECSENVPFHHRIFQGDENNPNFVWRQYNNDDILYYNLCTARSCACLCDARKRARCLSPPHTRLQIHSETNFVPWTYDPRYVYPHIFLLVQVLQEGFIHG